MIIVIFKEEGKRMKRSLLLMLAVLLVVGILAACSQESPATGTNEGAVANTNEDTKAAFPREYTDATGETVKLDEMPEKVVALFHVLLPDVMLTLGIEPAAVTFAETDFNMMDAYKSYLPAGGFADAGQNAPPSFETLVELEPDLILALKGVSDEFDEQLRAIAPVVYFDVEKGDDMNYLLPEFGRLFGLEDKAAAELDKYNAAVKDGAAKIKAFREKGETVVVASAWGEYTFGMPEPSDILFAEAGFGLTLPDNYPVKDGGEYVEYTLETLAELDPEHIIFNFDKNTYPTIDDLAAHFSSDPVWANLKAVKNGNLYLLDTSAFAWSAPIATYYGTEKMVEFFGNQ
jgi:iron complex transport system substrate-binding protein